jgi:hypothetical protein
MSLFPSAPGGVQIEVLPRWPGKIVATGGIKSEATGGTVTIQGDIPSLVVVSPEDNEGRYVWVYNEETETNERVELKNLPTQDQSWDQIENKPTEFPPETHTHPSTEISDSTAVGRAVLTAADEAAARTALDAAQASHTHTASEITDFSEAVDDRVGSLLQEGGGINLSYDDITNSLTISSDAIAPQTSVATFTAIFSTSGIIPFDTTIPEFTEGVSLLSVSITPNATSNKVRLLFKAWCATGADTTVIAALFRGTTCIDSIAVDSDVDSPTLLSVIFEDEPSTTAAITYTIRIGTADAAALRVNRVSPGAHLGGSSVAILIAHEVLP